MHELSLMNNLMHQIEAIAKDAGARRIVAVRLRLGAASHMSPAHLREHYAIAARGSIAEHAKLIIHAAKDLDDPQAGGIVLESIDVEKGESTPSTTLGKAPP